MKKLLSLEFLLLITIGILLSACGSQNSNNSQGAGSNGDSVKINNLEKTITFDKAPEHAVTLNQHATEIMLALGLEESMVGTAYLDDEILPKYKDAYKEIPVLSETSPSKEVFLASNPDFAYGGFSSAFSAKNIGTRDQLAELGIKTYLHQSSNTKGAEIEDVYEDIRNIGKIFRVEDRADQLIKELKGKIQKITKQAGDKATDFPVFVYDSGTDKAFTVGDSYLGHLIATAGGKNIFDDIPKSWTEVSWEEVVYRKPEVIVIVDYGKISAEQKIESLLNNPKLKNVPAIKDKHFVVLPLSGSVPGIRAPLALNTLIDGFNQEGKTTWE
ncbi:ABC transporter substrate-binding protein [Pseudalkalibacillus decolorationis]|uniref:ABC transporter substrate-binding protein n=1 Tax=Pseudalkalibacillus decolorationis TaxID=163879 RepID=UPI00214734C0|nr:ABC transporter substrate-binding protein [Pseudalkalibacillus decolorationis]